MNHELAGHENADIESDTRGNLRLTEETRVRHKGKRGIVGKNSREGTLGGYALRRMRQLLFRHDI